jgi:hypothetical protein
MAQTIEIESDSLDLAKQLATENLPVGHYVVSFNASPEGHGTATGTGATSGLALNDCRSKLPHGAEIVEQQVLQSALRKVEEVPAKNADAARIAVQSRLSKNCTIQEVRLSKPGQSRFLGLGKSHDRFEVTVVQSAVIEVAFRKKARVTMNMDAIPKSGHCQKCGRGNAQFWEKEKVGGFFFCPAQCKNQYFTSIFMLSADNAKTSRGYCWSCGKAIPLLDKTCPECDKPQELKFRVE